MRVLIVGANNEQVASAIGIAVRQRRATLRHVATPEAAVQELRAGRGADLLLIDVAVDIARLIGALGAERICVPGGRLRRRHRCPRRGRRDQGRRPGVPAAAARRRR